MTTEIVPYVTYFTSKTANICNCSKATIVGVIMKLIAAGALTLALAANLAHSGTALAWGQSGHSVIAELAQRHLSTRALAAINALIGDASLASISNWADDYKFTPEGKGTYRWHFVDIDIAHPTYDPAIDCLDENNQGTCIV